MAEQKKIQLYTDRACTVEASPETMAKNVTLSDGLDVESVLKHDLTAPTVVHEETSFKIGVGDIDVSSSVVDGEPSKVVIKGKTYQNILPEPSLRNSMTNGKSMQKLNEGYENVNVVDGVAKSAILKGNTLVNVFPSVNDDRFLIENSTTLERLEDGFLRVNAPHNGRWQIATNTIPIKPSTKYLLITEVKNNTVDGRITLANTTGFTTNSLTKVDIGFNGVLKQIITTLDVLEDYIFQGWLDSGTTGFVDIRNVLIEYQDGMENWNIPYFEGMQSVRMPVLTTTGKNLWDNEALKNCPIVAINNDGSLTLNGTMSQHWMFEYTVDSGTYSSSAVGNDSGYVHMFWRGGDDYFQTTKPVIISERATIKGYVAKGTYDNVNVKLQLEESSTPTTYEPYKSNILSTPSDLILGSVGDVCDTLDIINNNVKQMTHEFVIDGSQNIVYSANLGNTSRYYISLPYIGKDGSTAICDKIQSIASYSLDAEHLYISANDVIIFISNDTVQMDVSQLKAYLSENPITVRYILGQEVHKTVDLSSFGNWDKVVLNGSEDWVVSSKGFTNCVQFVCKTYSENTVNDTYGICDRFNYSSKSVDAEGFDMVTSHFCYITISKSRLSTPDLSGFKQYLSQNPITLWYQTTTSKANSITEMLSFNDGHIQLSSEEGSLIPSLDYEVPTRNSYHLDLAKTSTQYTMKNMSGTFTLDGNSYTASSNGTFTTPSTMTNKLMINSVEQTNPMIIEGNFTSTTLPYFTGIKYAFEGESKIEVLSTGKNLFDLTLTQGRSTYEKVGEKPSIANGDTRVTNQLNNYIEITPNTKITFSILNNIDYAIGQLDGNGNSLGDTGWVGYQSAMPNYTLTTKPNAKYIGFNFRKTDNSAIKVEEVLNSNPMLEIGSSPTTYEPYKSNVCKIPLLSPLRSLPNGVCDELIIDRMKKKAKIIQRVGKAMFDGSDSEIWGFMDSPSDTTSYLYQCYVRDAKANSNDTSEHLLCKNILVRTANSNWNNKYESGIALNENKNIQLRCTKDESSFRSWLSKNPTTVYYQLETPVVTEIDLESFPLVYKDGHIFLNSEIAPVVEIAYSINQSQQIQSNNETLQRHELDILDLDNLIVSFVNAEYNLRLLKFDMELSMMALAE